MTGPAADVLMELHRIHGELTYISDILIPALDSAERAYSLVMAAIVADESLADQWAREGVNLADPDCGG